MSNDAATIVRKGNGSALPATFTTGYKKDLAEARRRILQRQAARDRDESHNGRQR